jgi:large subunit ribosomal protein L10
MSKYVKNLVSRDIASRLKDVESVAVISPRGINAIRNNQMRRKLREKGARMVVVKNSLARRALAESKLHGFEGLLDGPSALVFGKASISTIARLLLDERKIDEKLELRGIYFDGEIYPGQKGVEQVSKLPTREEAIGTLAAIALSPGRNLGAIFMGQGGTVASLLKAVEEKAKEKEAAGATAPAAA